MRSVRSGRKPSQMAGFPAARQSGGWAEASPHPKHCGLSSLSPASSASRRAWEGGRSVCVQVATAKAVESGSFFSLWKPFPPSGTPVKCFPGSREEKQNRRKRSQRNCANRRGSGGTLEN